MYPGYDSKALSESREELIRSLKLEGVLKSKVVEDAIRAIPRDKFLWQGTPTFLAYADEPQLLGDTGQTISAPHMVVMMLEALEITPGSKILEVGCGSGYQAALLGWIASRGKSDQLVVSIERDGRLVEFARNNIAEVGLSKIVDVVEGDGTLGYPQECEDELYDRIIVAAGARRIPLFLKKQLETGGILLVPVGGVAYQKLLKIRKRRLADGSISFDERSLVDCMFVPLVGHDQPAY
ncbi:MAG: protein-L-isoaspartate O-methyltransferase [Nitrososphaerales archaeon]